MPFHITQKWHRIVCKLSLETKGQRNRTSLHFRLLSGAGFCVVLGNRVRVSLFVFRVHCDHTNEMGWAQLQQY